MSLSPQFFDQIGQIVLRDEGDAHMGSNSEVESWESNPQMGEAFICDCF